MKKLFSALLVLTFAVILSPTLHASDHADPIKATALEPGITGLFVFQTTDAAGQDHMTVILTVRRSLTKGPNYDVEPYEYRVHMDLRGTRVSYASEEDRLRYGGTIDNPTDISAEATIRFRLTKKAEFKTDYPKLEGDLDGAQFKKQAGVYDDPFIFPRFFGTNVIAMAVEIPMSAFPPGQRDWIIWGTSHKAKNGKQIDHVGRSNRTQLGRLDFLNTIEPKDQLAAIEKRLKGGNKLSAGISHVMGHFLPIGAIGGLFEYVFQIRDYDQAVDVMYFTTRPVVPGTETAAAPTPIRAGFPNGRRLTDDVAALTCAVGDCVLQELSFIEGHWPRAVVNDKPFKPTFPYLADKWPDKPEQRGPFHWDVFVFWLIGVLILLWIILRWRKRQAEKQQPYVR